MLETVQNNGIDRESSDTRKTRESINTEFLELVGSRIKKIRKEKKIHPKATV